MVKIGRGAQPLIEAHNSLNDVNNCSEPRREGDGGLQVTSSRARPNAACVALLAAGHGLHI